MHHIYTKPVGGGEPAQLTFGSEDDLFPAWSPDGRQIAFCRRTPSPDERAPVPYGIFVIPSLGGTTRKMARGHRGANHPIKDLLTGKVEITSQNHGFVVDPESLPSEVQPTHLSLFDNTNEGFQVIGKPVCSVQHHPEASPGPQDSHYLFERFIALMDENA